MSPIPCAQNQEPTKLPPELPTDQGTLEFTAYLTDKYIDKITLAMLRTQAESEFNHPENRSPDSRFVECVGTLYAILGEHTLDLGGMPVGKNHLLTPT
jgi:hypothetical protein